MGFEANCYYSNYKWIFQNLPNRRKSTEIWNVRLSSVRWIHCLIFVPQLDINKIIMIWITDIVLYAFDTIIAIRHQTSSKCVSVLGLIIYAVFWSKFNIHEIIINNVLLFFHSSANVEILLIFEFKFSRWFDICSQ